MNKKLLLWLLPVLVAGCAHQTPFTPSQGHIDSNQAEKAVAVPGDIPKPVKSAAYLPPPKPKAKEQTYSVVVNDVPVREILFALARESKLNVDIHPGITGNVTLNAVDQTLPAILERISKQIDLTYKLEGNVMSVSPDLPTLKTYKVNYVNMDRDTTSSIGVAAQIASTGSTAGSGGTSGSSTTTSGSGNNSNTLVSSKSKNNFWELLSENIKTILRTTKSQVAIAQETSALISSAQEALDKAARDEDGKEPASGKQAQQSRDALLKLVKERAADAKDEVIINPVAGTITVMATARQHEFIRQYISTVMDSVQRQVLIEATIVEVQLNDQFSSGIDWSRLGPKGFTFEQKLNTPNESNPIGTGIFSSTSKFVIGYANNTVLGNLAASINLLEKFGNTKVLSSPKLMALNNQTAILKVVNNLVYFTATATTTTNTSTSNDVVTTTPHTIPVGVVMGVTPQINDDGNVTLNVRPTISRFTGQKQDPNPKLTIPSYIPEIQVREMESVLQVRSGQTIILGGLMEDFDGRNKEGIPEVSKIPLFGRLFQSRNDKASKSELVIFLRSTVIPNASLESDELKAFKQFLPDQLPAVTTDESVN